MARTVGLFSSHPIPTAGRESRSLALPCSAIIGEHQKKEKEGVGIFCAAYMLFTKVIGVLGVSQRTTWKELSHSATYILYHLESYITRHR